MSGRQKRKRPRPVSRVQCGETGKLQYEDYGDAGVPRKLWTREPHHAACVDASSPIWPALCSAKNFSSNSTGGTIPNAECNRRRL